MTQSPDRLRPTKERAPLWPVPELSTTYADALDAYRAGVVGIDPNFLMGRAAPAAAAAMSGSSVRVLGPFDAAFAHGTRLDRHDATTAALRSVPRPPRGQWEAQSRARRERSGARRRAGADERHALTSAPEIE